MVLETWYLTHRPKKFSEMFMEIINQRKLIVAWCLRIFRKGNQVGFRNPIHKSYRYGNC